MHTLDELSAFGVKTLAAHCPACETDFEVPIRALDVPGETSVSAVTRLRPLACPKCSGPAELTAPDSGGRMN